MTPNHASYQVMDTTKPWAEDPAQDVPGKKKNKLVNRAFTWMFHVAVTDPQGSLSWLLPKPSKDADSAVDELFQKVMIDEDDNESPLVGPVMLATFAWAVMCAPWYSVAFQSSQQSSTKPSHEVWFREHLDWYSRWNPQKLSSYVAQTLKAFYNQFPEARRLINRRKSGSSTIGCGGAATSSSSFAEDLPVFSD